MSWDDWDAIDAAQAELERDHERRRKGVLRAAPQEPEQEPETAPARTRWGEPPPPPRKVAPGVREVKLAILALLRHGTPAEREAAAGLAEAILDAEK